MERCNMQLLLLSPPQCIIPLQLSRVKQLTLRGAVVGEGMFGLSIFTEEERGESDTGIE